MTVTGTGVYTCMTGGWPGIKDVSSTKGITLKRSELHRTGVLKQAMSWHQSHCRPVRGWFHMTFLKFYKKVWWNIKWWNYHSVYENISVFILIVII